MIRRGTLFPLMFSLALSAFAGIGRADVKQVPVARLHAMMEIAAPPAAIWSHMTTGRNLVTWCPVWRSAKNARINIMRVGDVLDFTDEWGKGGRSVVTYLVRNKEIRVAHEPTDGSYMCQAKLVLEPSGMGTVVHYYEQYTDESPQKDFDATAQKIQTEMDQTLHTLKKSVEKRS
jgi:uncharacterized protein YndB with AHSA1/START domain